MQEPKVQIKGKVLKGPDNLYWQRNLKGGPGLWKATEVLAYPLGIFLLFLILLYSSLLVLFFKLKPRHNQPLSKEAEGALYCYDYFLDVYPTSTYPIINKALELALFKEFALNEPSLEMGTGDGYFTSRLYKSQNEKLTIASDLICDTLLQASKYDFWRKMAIIDASELPLQDNSLQTAIMNNLIHHLPDRIEILDEMYRVLRPGGTFLVTDELINWATSQWYLSFGIGSKWHEKWLDKFLQTFIQTLISSKEFWVKTAAEKGWEVLYIKEIFSSKGMYYSSFLETLNLKFGKPTHKAIRGILNAITPLKKLQYSLTRSIVEYLIRNDEELCEKHGGTTIFVALKKKEISGPVKINEAALACPTCKTILETKDNGFYCKKCHKEFLQFKGVPFLLSYNDELPLKSYIEQLKGKKIPDYYS